MRGHVKAYDGASIERKAAASERAQRREHLSAAQRTDAAAKLRVRDGAICAYCKRLLGSEFHVDHKTPVRKGGGHELANLALACIQCNQEKHSKTVAEYRSWRVRVGLPVAF